MRNTNNGQILAYQKSDAGGDQKQDYHLKWPYDENKQSCEN